MDSPSRASLISGLEARVGRLRKLDNSQSLFESADGAFRFYLRYSKTHGGNKTFYGLRRVDLNELHGRESFVCFLWDSQSHPLLVPYKNFESIFDSVSPASDGQYKAQLYSDRTPYEIYVAGAGRFHIPVDAGWEPVDSIVQSQSLVKRQNLTHSQVQTLLGSIGIAKGFDVWIPSNNRLCLDWALVPKFDIRPTLSAGIDSIQWIVEEIDVVWIDRSTGGVVGAYEVEHTTPIYSGLLRFNDLWLESKRSQALFTIVADQDRRSVFVRQLQRPTFKKSGLSEKCSFLDYEDVHRWHDRVANANCTV